MPRNRRDIDKAEERGEVKSGRKKTESNAGGERRRERKRKSVSD
jgi:hypothetical protein